MDLKAKIREVLKEHYGEFDSFLEIEYENIRDALGADPRIGPAWLDVNHRSYRGFGGYCFPKDLNAFIKFVIKLRTNYRAFDKLISGGFSVLQSVWKYNETLLEEQGLSIEDVSKHNKELILKKKKDIG